MTVDETIRKASGTIQLKNIVIPSSINNYWVKCDVYDLETGENINADMNTWNKKRKIPIYSYETGESLNPFDYEGKTINGVIEFSDRWNAGRLRYEARKILFQNFTDEDVTTPFNPFNRNKYYKEHLEPAEPVHVWSILDATSRPISYSNNKLVVLDKDTNKYVPADLEITHKACDSNAFLVHFAPSEFKTSWCKDLYEYEGTKVAWSRAVDWWLPIPESECFLPEKEPEYVRPKRKLSNDPNIESKAVIKPLLEVPMKKKDNDHEMA